MGLVRGMARTAVIAGTATAVSNRVSRRQANRWQQQEYADQYQLPPAYPQQAYVQPAPAPAPPPPPAAAPESALIEQLQRLGELRNQGVLTDDEFASAKAKLLGM